MNLHGKPVWLVVDPLGPGDTADVSHWTLGSQRLIDYIVGVSARYGTRRVNIAWHDDEPSAREDAARRMAKAARPQWQSCWCGAGQLGHEGPHGSVF